MKRWRFAALVLALAVLAAIGVPVYVASNSAGAVSVLAIWTDAEENQFKQVLDAFTATTGTAHSYRGTRAVSQVVQSSVQGGTPPDVAVLQSPGELMTYARRGQLRPLDDVLEPAQRDAYGSQWLMPLAIDGQRHIYAVPVKANLKSLVWFNPTRSPRPAPKTWDELVAYGRTIAAAGGTPWCMGMGDPPASGWSGTDFIEDILLHRSGPEVYRAWAAGTMSWTDEAVRNAWTIWGELATNGTGGAKSVLLTDFGDAGRGMFANPRGCFLEHQASFIKGIYQEYRDPDGATPRAGVDFDFFDFPPFDPSADPVWEASADFAVMFNDTPQARELMRFLATEQAQRIWPEIKQASAFTANKRVEPTVYGDDAVSTRIARTFRDAPMVCLDAADIMPAPMRNAFNRAVLEYLGNPGRLGALLANLEQVRQDLARSEWLDLPCGQ